LITFNYLSYAVGIMWDYTLIELATFLLLVGVSVRLYIQNNLLNRMSHYLWEVEEENKKEMVQFMEGFAEALVVFEKEESVSNNARTIKEWDES